MHHTAPLNSPIHLALLKSVEEAGFDPDVLRSLLWLINAHDQLIAFPRICANVANIVEEAVNTWGIVASHPILEAVVPMLRWIPAHGPTLDLGSDFNRQPSNNKDHPVMGRGSRRHPLYATLWNTCEVPALQPKYLLLQAHLLFAYAKQVEANTVRSDYEYYGNQDEWEGIPNSPYPACLTVRELSEAKFSSILSNLQVEMDFMRFAESLSSLPNTHTTEEKNRLKHLRDFLQKSSGLKNWIKRTGSGGHSGTGGSEKVTGYVEITPNVFKQDLPISDPDDPDQAWGYQSMVTDMELDPDKQKDLLALDLSPEEFDAQEMLLSGYDSPLTGTLAANSAAQLRHVAMANQLFPWAFSQLTIADFGPAFIQMGNWVIELFVGRPDTATRQDWDKLEAFTLLRIMIFTGSSFERARKILVLPESHANEGGDLAFLQIKDQSYAFQVRAIHPNYRTSNPVSDGTDLPRTDDILLPDISTTHGYINLLTDKRNSSSQRTINDFRLFHRQPGTLKNNLMALLKEMDPTGRLTPHKASIFLHNRIMQVTRGDICAASLICGDLHRLARVRLFYSILTAETLQKIYLEATKELVGQLLHAGNKQFPVQNPAIEQSDCFVGSRFCPKTESVIKAISGLKSDLRSAGSPSESHEAHNLYTLLTLWHFTFAIACRAIETPYLPLAQIDPESGIAIFADKDDGTGYKARLIWVPPEVLGQMNAYEQHRASLPQASESTEPIFFLVPGRKGAIESTPVRPKSMAPIMEKYLKYPANFHRRFMRTELLSRGCPMEVVDAWMGHWHFGEEPWGRYSSFSFQEYKETLETFLTPLLNDLGLDGTILTPTKASA
ncbi:MAG: site-specific integrase [Betaproteobacteria bacterium]|nr:site-specific integrase [Betaproteobacteria bacterium]